jgi:hypothetical protein
MLISKRPCKIGTSINTRTEKHGDEDVPACDIPLVGIMLQAEELNALLGDQNAHKSLFAKAKGGAPQEPLFRQLKPFVLRDRFEDGAVTLTLGLNGDEIEFDDVTLARVTLEPRTGGLTELSVQVQCSPPVEDMARAIAFLNCDADAEIEFGKRAEPAKRKQKDLGLSFEEPGDADGAATQTH